MKPPVLIPIPKKTKKFCWRWRIDSLKTNWGYPHFARISPKTCPPESEPVSRHLLFIEDIGPRRTIRSLFSPDFVFPPLEKMGEMELEHKIESIKSILMDHGILLELWPALPPDLTYAYIVEEMLPESVHRDIPEGSAVHFTGCGGWCPECFQKEYCETRKEEWPETAENNFLSGACNKSLKI